MFLQYSLLIFAFIIALIGWFKPKKVPKSLSIIVIIILFISSIIQSVIIHNNKNERSSDKTQIIKLMSSYDSINVQNIKLLSSNREFLEQIKNYQSELENQKTSIETIKEYAAIAKLNPFGKPYATGYGLEYKTGISRIMEDALLVEEGKVNFKFTENALNRYKETIKNYPKFPFSYYALALYYKNNSDLRWELYANQAISILEKTTQIDGHHITHDSAYNKLKS